MRIRSTLTFDLTDDGTADRTDDRTVLRATTQTVIQAVTQAVTQSSARASTCLATLCALCALGTVAPAFSQDQMIVGSVEQLHAALGAARAQGPVAIALRDGEYRLAKALVLDVDGVSLRSLSGDRDRVVLRGNGMRKSGRVDNLIEVSGRGVSVIGLTLQEAGTHLIQLRGERDADNFSLINCVLRDSYEQMLKVSSPREGVPSADFGVVKNSLFEYSEDFGPNYYIGGIDLHSGKNWLIAGNTFRNIASPSQQVAEHAIHIWKNSADNVVRDNLILNSDRGIGFGLTSQWYRHNRGGEIIGNVILHLRPEAPFADVGIGLEVSPDTLVSGNFIYQLHNYPNAIEYRFEETRDVIISGNHTNKAIASRDGAEGLVVGNSTASMAGTAMDYLRTALERLSR